MMVSSSSDNMALNNGISELVRMWKEDVMASFTGLNIPEELRKTTRNINEDLPTCEALVVPTKL
jgi:hypothetical protein